MEPHAHIEVSEFAAAAEAIAALRESAPDLLVLDVQMQEFQRLGSLEALGLDPLPALIATAYDRHVLEAFPGAAVDRLQKPFDGDRFEAALSRAKLAIERSRKERSQPRSPAPPSGSGSGGWLQRFVVKQDSCIFFVPADEVDWIQSAANYVRLHAAERTYTVRETMQRLIAALDPRRFLRVHRNAIVNLASVQHFETLGTGRMSVLLRDGTRVSLSRAYQGRVRQLLRNSA
jgi:two-component system LytT family response regulator